MPSALRGRRFVTHSIRLALALTFAAAGWLFGEQVWLFGKAMLAERLIERAYRQHQLDGKTHPPWPWADTHPLGKLVVPALRVERTVLAGASGASLAFGPGHVDGTALPNRPGLSAIAGHRDGSFAFLGRLSTGDRLRLETRERTATYRVRDARIVRFDDATDLRQNSGSGSEMTLKLVTCWPIDGILPGPLRYVLDLEAIEVSDRNLANDP